MTTWNEWHVQLHNQSCPTLRRASQTRYPAWRKILISRFFNILLFWGGLELWRDFLTETRENASTSKYFLRWNYCEWNIFTVCCQVQNRFVEVCLDCLSLVFVLKTHVPIPRNIILIEPSVWKGLDLIWIWIYLRILLRSWVNLVYPKIEGAYFLVISGREFDLTTVLGPCWPPEWRRRGFITSGCLKRKPAFMIILELDHDIITVLFE